MVTLPAVPMTVRSLQGFLSLKEDKKITTIMGYEVIGYRLQRNFFDVIIDDEIVCTDCATTEEEIDLTANEIIFEDDIKGEGQVFCARCKRQIGIQKTKKDIPI